MKLLKRKETEKEIICSLGEANMKGWKYTYFWNKPPAFITDRLEPGEWICENKTVVFNMTTLQSFKKGSIEFNMITELMKVERRILEKGYDMKYGLDPLSLAVKVKKDFT